MGHRFGPLRYLQTLFIIITLFTLDLGWSLQATETDNRSESSDRYTEMLTRLTLDVSSMLEVRLKELQNNLASTTTNSTRSKRAVLKNAPSPSELGVLRLIKPGQSLPSPSILVDLAYVSTSSRAYLIGAGRWNLDGSIGKVACPVWQWNYQTKQFDMRTRVHVVSAIGVEAFVINDEAYFIFALNVKGDLMDSAVRSSKLYKILPNGKTKVILSIPTTAATSWQSLQVGSDLFLIQASYLEWRRFSKNQRKRAVVPKDSSEIRIFQWFKNSFAKVDSLNASHTTDLEVTTIAGRHFIAVVNQTFAKDYVESTLLIYEMKSKTVRGVPKVELFQKITGWAVSDITFVKVGTELFLAVAYEFRVHNGLKVYEVESVIFRYNGLHFVKYQTVATSCALRWTAIYGSEGEAMLHLQSSEQEQLLQFVEGSWVMLPLSLLGVVGLGKQRMGVAGFVQGEVNNVAVAAPNQNQLLELGFAVESRQAINDELLRKCHMLKDKLQRQNQNRQSVENERRMVSLSQPQELRGRKHFNRIHIKNLYLRKIPLQQPHIFERLLTDRLNLMEGLLGTLDWAGFLTKSSPQEVTASIAVNDLTVDHLVAPNVQFTDVNGVNLCRFLQKLVWFPPTSATKVPAGALQFTNLKLPHGFNLSGTLNNLRIPNDVVFLDRPNFFTAPKHFTQGIEIQGNLLVNGTVNGIRPEDILLAEGDQVIHGDVIFQSDIDVTNLDQLHDGRVNGVLWSWLLNEPLRLDVGGVVTDKKEFVASVTIQGNLMPERLVAGVDVGRLIDKAVPLRGRKVFKHGVHFRDATFEQHLFVRGRVNGLHLPHDVVLLSQTMWPVTLNLTSTWVTNLLVEGLVNGLKVDRQHIMTRTDHQIVTGHKTFHNMMAHTDVAIMGHLNAQNVSDLIQNIPRPRVELAEFYPTMSVRDLRITGPLPRALHQLLFQSVQVNEPYAFPGQVVFQDTVTFKKDLVAPEAMFLGLLPVKSPEPLNLPLTTFHDVVFEDHVMVEGQLNGYDAAALVNDVLLTVGDQIVTAPKEFLNPVILKNHSEFRGPVNGANLADALTLDGRGKLPPRIEFATPPTLLGENTFQTVVVNNLLNGRPVVDWLADTLLTEGDQKIDSHKQFVHGMKIGVNNGVPTKDLNVNGIIYLDGINLVELMKDVVLVNESNEIMGPTTFAADVTFKDFHAPVVDGVDVTGLFAVALKRNEERCPTFQSSISTASLFSPVINGVNIDEFLRSVVFLTDEELPGHLHFAEVRSPSVDLTGLVNEVKFSHDVVRKNGQELTVIAAPKTFVVPLSMNHVKVNGLVNGIDIVKLDQTAMKQGIAQVIHGDLEVNELIARRDILVNGLVDGINFGAFLKDAMYVDEDARIQGLKEFNTLLYQPEPPRQLIIGGLLDNVNLTYVANNMVTLDTPQVISGPLTFAENLDSQNLEVANMRLGEDSTVNNVKLPEWARTVMKTEGPQVVTGTKTFMGEVVIEQNLITKRTVNQILIEDVVRLSGGQRIDGAKNFHQVEVQTIEVQGLLMDVDVQLWAEHALMTDRSEPAIIHGRKEFDTLVLNTDAVFESTIDGVALDNLMLTRGDQVITGTKKFAGNLTVPRWADIALQGPLNGSPQPLPLVMEQLLTSPLPYPCQTDFIYHEGWCYKVHTYTGVLAVNAQEVCAQLHTELLSTLDDQQRKLFARMGLEESPDGWLVQGTSSNVFTCIHKASVNIKKPMKITGSFLFNGSKTTHGPQQTNLRSPVEDEFNELQKVIHQLDAGINTESKAMNSRMRDVCSAVDGINHVFKNAYRPMGEFRILQYFPPQIRKIYKLEQAIMGLPSFLSLEGQKMALYFWQNNTFFEVASDPLTSEVGELLDIEHDIFQDGLEVVLLLPTSTRHCPRSKVGNVEVLQVKIRLNEGRPSLDVFRVSNLGFHCTRPSNLDVVSVGGKNLLLIGLENTLEVWNWNTQEPKFDLLLKHNELQRILFVRAIGTEGHVLVANGKDDGSSLLTMYRTIIYDNFGVMVEASIHQSGVISHLSSVVSSNDMHLIMLDGSQLKLLQYHPESKWFNLKQVMESYPSATQLYWVPMPQFAWIFVASCGHADSYEFSGYLSNHKTLDVTIIDKPHLFHMHHTVNMVVKLKLNGNEHYVNLQSVIKGPTDYRECQLQC